MLEGDPVGGGPCAGRGAYRKLGCCAEDYSVALVGAVNLERVMGIEPTLSAWEAEVLPLNYTRSGLFCRAYHIDNC